MKKISTAELQMYMAELQKISGLNATQFKPIDREAKEFASRYQRLKRQEKEKKQVSESEHELKPSITMDMHLYRCCFGKGSYTVLNDAFYQYNRDHGYWSAVPDQDVLKAITLTTDKTFKWIGPKNARYKRYCGSISAASSGLKYARSILTKLSKSLPSNKHLRAFKNCTVDMRTGATTQHSPDHYLTSAISCDYDPDAQCPQVFMDFLLSSYGEDMVLIVRAAISMILDPTAPWGKFIHIVGPSGSGKGVMIRLLQKLFGEDSARSGNSFSEFIDADKRHQNLQGASLYVIPDIQGYQKGLEAFYELVDNGPMSGRALFSSAAYSIQWDVRFAIASVEYLQLENSAGGWDRRVIPLLTQRRTESSEIPNLENQLEENRAGIIAWALSMDKKERNQVIKKPWDYSDRIATSMHESKTHGDSVASFVDRCLIPIPFGSKAAEPIVHPGLIHDWYTAYCKAHSLTPKGQPKFISHLKTIIPKHYTPRRRAKPGETEERGKDGKLKRLPAKWSWIQAISGVFEQDEDPATGLSRNNLICRKQSCQEGSLELFSQWEPTKEHRTEIKPGGQGGHLVAEKSISLERPQAGGGQGGQGGQGKRLASDKDEIFERF